VFQTLYTYPNNFRAYKALIAAQYSGADVKVDSAFEFGVTNKEESFLKKFPQGKVMSKYTSSVDRSVDELNDVGYLFMCLKISVF